MLSGLTAVVLAQAVGGAVRRGIVAVGCTTAFETSVIIYRLYLNFYFSYYLSTLVAVSAPFHGIPQLVLLQ